MALVDPRPLADLADLLPIQSTRWQPFRLDQLEIYGSSQTLAINLAEPLWSAELVIDTMRWNEARELQAAINSLQGAEQTFLFANRMHRAPQLDPAGAALAGFTPKIHTVDSDRRRVRFKGLPAGYQLRRGDFWHVDFASSTRRGLFELSENVAADGSGITPLVPVFPNLWPGIAAEANAVFVNPACKVFVMPGEYDAGATARARVGGMRLRVLQKL